MYWIYIMNLIMPLAIVTPFMKHPISMGLILIMQTILICISLSMMTKSSWYSFILFISMISGMMIMFMYTASITSNNKFKFNYNIVIMLMIISLLMVMMDNMILETINSMMELKLNSINLEEVKSTTKFFNQNKGSITMLMIMMLLITMIAVTTLTSTYKGPLKKKKLCLNPFVKKML